MSCCVTEFPWCVTRHAGEEAVYHFRTDAGADEDLTGWDFRFEIEDGDGVPVLVLTPGSGLIVSGSEVKAVLTQSQTASLTAGGTYYADLRVVPAVGEPYYPPIRLVLNVRTPVAVPPP